MTPVFTHLQQLWPIFFSDQNIGSLQLLVVADNAQKYIETILTGQKEKELSWRFTFCFNWEYMHFQCSKWSLLKERLNASSINICFITLLPFH